MALENAKESAFPNTWTVKNDDGSVVTTIVHGLTMREYFAGLAMQGKLSGGEFHDNKKIEDFAKSAVEYADALLLELEK